MQLILTYVLLSRRIFSCRRLMLSAEMNAKRCKQSNLIQSLWRHSGSRHKTQGRHGRRNKLWVRIPTCPRKKNKSAKWTFWAFKFGA